MQVPVAGSQYLRNRRRSIGVSDALASSPVPAVAPDLVRVIHGFIGPIIFIEV